MLYIMYCIWFIIYYMFYLCILYIICCMLYIIYYIKYSILYIIYYMLYIIYYILYIIYYILYIIYYILYIIYYILYIIYYNILYIIYHIWSYIIDDYIHITQFPHRPRRAQTTAPGQGKRGDCSQATLRALPRGTWAIFSSWKPWFNWEKCRKNAGKSRFPREIYSLTSHYNGILTRYEWDYPMINWGFHSDIMGHSWDDQLGIRRCIFIGIDTIDIRAMFPFRLFLMDGWPWIIGHALTMAHMGRSENGWYTLPAWPSPEANQKWQRKIPYTWRFFERWHHNYYWWIFHCHVWLLGAYHGFLTREFTWAYSLVQEWYW